MFMWPPQAANITTCSLVGMPPTARQKSANGEATNADYGQPGGQLAGWLRRNFHPIAARSFSLRPTSLSGMQLNFSCIIDHLRPQVSGHCYTQDLYQTVDILQLVQGRARAIARRTAWTLASSSFILAHPVLTGMTPHQSRHVPQH